MISFLATYTRSRSYINWPLYFLANVRSKCIFALGPIAVHTLSNLKYTPFPSLPFSVPHSDRALLFITLGWIIISLLTTPKSLSPEQISWVSDSQPTRCWITLSRCHTDTSNSTFQNELNISSSCISFSHSWYTGVIPASSLTPDMQSNIKMCQFLFPSYTYSLLSPLVELSK